MRLRVLIGLVLLSLPWVGPTRAAQPGKDPAEWLPARTLVYGELRDPGRLMKGLADLFQGSALDNVPDSLVRMQTRLKQPGLLPKEVGMSALFLLPETVKEVQRIQGVAAALTGFDQEGKPEYVVIILPGQSNIPGLAMHAFLNSGPEPIGEVEGVTLYRQVPHILGENTTPEIKAEAVRQRSGPAFALAPAALLVGTPEAVKEVIRRIKGKVKTPSLATEEAYQEAGKQIGDPEIFVYQDFAGTLEAVAKNAKLGSGDQKVLSGITRLLDPNSIRAVAGGLTLDKGALRFRKLVLLNPGAKSPVLEILPSEAVKTDLLDYAPKDAVLAAALSNADGAKRWARLLAVADELAKAGGQQELPSEQVGQVEKALGIDFGKDLLGKITDVAVAMGDPFKAPVKPVNEKKPGVESVQTKPEVPLVLIFQAEDEESAKTLVDEQLPKIWGLLLGQQDLKPTTKEVAGQTISTLPAKQEGETVNYGRHGKMIVVGPYPEPVAQALQNGAKNQGLLSDQKVADRIKGLDGPVVVALARPFTLVLGFTVLVPQSFEIRSETGTSPPPGGPGGNNPRPGPAPAAQSTPTEEAQGFTKMMEQLLKDEEPLLLGVTRKPDQILVQAELTGLKAMVPRLTDFLLEKALKSRAGMKIIAPSRPSEVKPDVRPAPPPGPGEGEGRGSGGK